MLNQSTANPPEPEREGWKQSEGERGRELECPVVFNKLHAICSSSNCSSSSSSNNLQHAALPLNLWQTGSCAELSLQSQMAMTTWAAGGGARESKRKRRRGTGAEEEGQHYCKKTNALAHEMQLMPHRKVVHVHVHLSASNMPHATHAPQEMWICHIEIQFDLSDDI